MSGIADREALVPCAPAAGAEGRAVVIEEQPPMPPAHGAAAPANGRPAADDHDGGPLGSLVCVIAACEPPDATAVALMLCWRAVSEGRAALCVEAAGPLGRLGAWAGAHSRYTLAEAASLAVQGRLAGADAVAVAPGGVHVIAAERRAWALEAEPHGPSEVATLLELARARYQLTVVDCATAATAAALDAYRQATHVVWALAGTPAGLADARRALARVRPHPTARELIVARGRHPSLGRVRPRRLRALAAERHTPEVICLPYLDELELPRDRERLLERCNVELRRLAALTQGAVVR